MLSVPEKVSYGLFDDFVDYPFGEMFKPFYRDSLFKKMKSNMMKTDIKELDESYELKMELPGYKKENVKIKIEGNYLTVLAHDSSVKDEKSQNGNYIRQERYCGSCKRSFYVGEGLSNDDIKANFKEGILQINFPKKSNQFKNEKHVEIHED